MHKVILQYCALCRIALKKLTEENRVSNLNVYFQLRVPSILKANNNAEQS